MGAALGCYGDQEADLSTTPRRRVSPSPRRSKSEDSMLHKLQRTLSATWRSSLRISSSSDRLTTSEDDDPVNSWDSFLLMSNKASASSGSRLLSAFYSRVLEENDDAACFFDSRGKRVNGPYLERVEMVDDYFACSNRKCGRSTSLLPEELVELATPSDHELDGFSTSSTMPSELDYWATSDPAFATDERLYDMRQLPPRACSSSYAGLFSPIHTGTQIRQVPIKAQGTEDSYSACCQSPWSSPPTKTSTSRYFASPSPYLASAVRSGTLAALMAS